MNAEERDTPYETFNWRFDALFAEDCRNSDGRLHHVCQGKLGMGLVVSYLSKTNWALGFPLDLVELKLQRLITELKHLQYAQNSVISNGDLLFIRRVDVARPVRSLNLTAKLKDPANMSAPELSFHRKAVEEFHALPAQLPPPIEDMPLMPNTLAHTGSTSQKKRNASAITDDDGDETENRHRRLPSCLPVVSISFFYPEKRRVVASSSNAKDMHSISGTVEALESEDMDEDIRVKGMILLICVELI
jgi:hypothetical protein